MAVDALMLAIAAAAAIISAPVAEVETDLTAMVVYSVLVLAVLRYLGVYRQTFATHFLDNARSILGATAIVAMAMTFMRVLVFDNPQAAEQAARAWLFSATYLIAARGAFISTRCVSAGVGSVASRR